MVISSSKIRQRVALVVAQHHLRLIRLDHTAYQLQRLPNLGAPVDNIAQKNHLALGMPVNTVQLAVPEFFQQAHQCMSTTVHIANIVVTLLDRAVSHRYYNSYPSHPNLEHTISYNTWAME